MTTGRINQVATNRVTPVCALRRGAHQHEVRMCVWNVRLRPCISFAIVLYHGSAPASAPSTKRGAAGKAGSAASATARFNLCSKHRRAALSDACNLVVWWLKKATIDSYNSKTRAQVIQSRTGWHSMLKQKKKSEAGASLVKHLLDVTWKRKTRNQRGCTKQRKEY